MDYTAIDMKKVNRFKDKVAELCQAIDENEIPIFETVGDEYTKDDSRLGEEARVLTAKGRKINAKSQRLWTKLYHLGAVAHPDYHMNLAIEYKDPKLEHMRGYCGDMVKHLGERDMPANFIEVCRARRAILAKRASD